MLIRERGEFKGLKVTNEDPAVVNCYTDGSKDEIGRTGAAFISKCLDSSCRVKGFFPLGPTTSVYQAEATAICQAAWVMLKNGTSGKTVNFYVDNQGVIQAVSKLEIKDKLIIETKKVLNELSVNNSVVLNWIPGHEGYRGNEIADRLAKRATRMPWIGCLPSMPVSSDQGRNACREKLSQRQVKNWSVLKKGTHTRDFFPELRPRESRYLLGLDIKSMNKLTGYITGHGLLNYHQFKLGNTVTTECRLCNEEDETNSHVLFECPAMVKIRLAEIGIPFVKKQEVSKMPLSSVWKLIKAIDKLLE